MRLSICFGAIALTQLLGCASIVNGQNQSVSVETRDAKGTVAGASCKLSNDKGTWYVTSPGSTTVHRSYGDLGISCEKDSLEPGMATVKSVTQAMAFGNILFGGAIGVGVDVATGAAYDYPTLIAVVFGQSTVVGAPASSASAPQGSPSQQLVSAAPAAPASGVVK